MGKTTWEAEDGEEALHRALELPPPPFHINFLNSRRTIISMSIISGLKKSIIKSFDDEDISNVIEKINELSQRKELILTVQRENGKVERIKIISWELVEHE